MKKLPERLLALLLIPGLIGGVAPLAWATPAAPAVQLTPTGDFASLETLFLVKSFSNGQKIEKVNPTLKTLPPTRLKYCLRFILFTTIFSLSLPSVALASPADETAGSEASRFRLEEFFGRDKAPDFEKSDDIVQEEEAIEGMDSKIKFSIDEIRLVGNESIPSEELRPLLNDLLETQVSLADVQRRVSKLKQYYRDQGFIASYAYVPPQKLDQKVLEIRIVEGKLGTLEVVGNKWIKKSTLQKQFHMEPGEVVHYQRLRRDLSFLNKRRDVKARASLKPGAESGTTDVLINIQDKFPVRITPTVNNLGTRNTGKERYGVGVTHTNVFGQLDQLSVRYQTGSGAWAIGTDYNIPINSYGTRLGATYSHAEVDLEGDFAVLDAEGEADVYGAYLLQPLCYTDTWETNAFLGFEAKEIENRTLGVVTGEDNLRVLNVGLNLEGTGRHGRTFLLNRFDFGFDSIFGGSDKVDQGAIRAGTGGQFWNYKGTLLRYQRLPKDMTLSLRGHVQLSADSLPPSEQLRLGGANSIRGYQEGEYLADYGAFGSAELWVPTYIFPEHVKLPFSDKPLRKRVQAVGFFDYGRGLLRKPLSGESSARYLAGAGGGLRVHLWDKLFARIEWATPVGGSEPNDGRGSAFYYGLSVDLLEGWVK